MLKKLIVLSISFSRVLEAGFFCHIYDIPRNGFLSCSASTGIRIHGIDKVDHSISSFHGPEIIVAIVVDKKTLMITRKSLAGRGSNFEEPQKVIKELTDGIRRHIGFEACSHVKSFEFFIAHKPLKMYSSRNNGVPATTQSERFDSNLGAVAGGCLADMCDVFPSLSCLRYQIIPLVSEAAIKKEKLELIITSGTDASIVEIEEGDDIQIT